MSHYWALNHRAIPHCHANERFSQPELTFCLYHLRPSIVELPPWLTLPNPRSDEKLRFRKEERSVRVEGCYLSEINLLVSLGEYPGFPGQDQAGKESPVCPVTGEWKNTQHPWQGTMRRPWRAGTSPGSGVKPVYNPFCKMRAWLNMLVITWPCRGLFIFRGGREGKARGFWPDSKSVDFLVKKRSLERELLCINNIIYCFEQWFTGVNDLRVTPIIELQPDPS